MTSAALPHVSMTEFGNSSPAGELVWTCSWGVRCRHTSRFLIVFIAFMPFTLWCAALLMLQGCSEQRCGCSQQAEAHVHHLRVWLRSWNPSEPLGNLGGTVCSAGLHAGGPLCPPLSPYHICCWESRCACAAQHAVFYISRRAPSVAVRSCAAHYLGKACTSGCL